MTALLVVCLFGATYSFLIYPVALAVIASVRRRGRIEDETLVRLPTVSLIVTAHNEAARIREKIENSLEIDYPELEIIVASDCSTDATDEIVTSFAENGVKLVRVEERYGKENAQLAAIRQSAGEIIVFSDTGTRIEPHGIARLASYFADAGIGAVSSEDRFIRDDGQIVGEGAYVRFEMTLRRRESQLGGLVGMSGSFFSVRREICEPWDLKTPSDFGCALNCARRSLRAVTASDVLGYYKDLDNPEAEFQRKVRTILRGITGLMRNWRMMSLRRYGIFAWQLISHKLMRWLVPLFLLVLFGLSGLYTTTSAAALLLFLAQLVFYMVAFAAHCSTTVRANALVRLIYFFCVVNVATVVSWWHFLAGKRVTVWQPSVRS